MHCSYMYYQIHCLSELQYLNFSVQQRETLLSRDTPCTQIDLQQICWLITKGILRHQLLYSEIPEIFLLGIMRDKVIKHVFWLTFDHSWIHLAHNYVLCIFILWTKLSIDTRLSVFLVTLIYMCNSVSFIYSIDLWESVFCEFISNGKWISYTTLKKVLLCKTGTHKLLCDYTQLCSALLRRVILFVPAAIKTWWNTSNIRWHNCRVRILQRVSIGFYYSTITLS